MRTVHTHDKTPGADPGGGEQRAHAPPIFGLAVPNLSPTLHARTPMTAPAPPPYFQILDPPLDSQFFCVDSITCNGFGRPCLG